MADILIRGMAKMPGNCRECMFAGFGGMRHELNVCMFSGESQSLISHERMSKCPLVPLPEGHGKIIDADAIWRNMPDDQAWVFQRGLASDLELFEILEAAESIIPAEGGTEK